MTTKQALAELKRLAKVAADTLYRRIALAATVMQDLDWIAQAHGGSDLKAQDALESEFFKDLGGFITIGKLIAMYRAVPATQWKDLKYDVAAIEVVYDEQAEKEPKQTRSKPSYKRLAAELEKRAESAESKLAQIETMMEEDRGKVERTMGRVEQLEKENAELREENQRLRSEIQKLTSRLAAINSAELAAV